MDKTFETRPKVRPRQGGIAAALRATATNGKSIRMKYVGGMYSLMMEKEGLRVRTQRQKDGTYLWWCEKA